jgi:hypothetical protein
MSREHARPQPPAGSRRYEGGADEPASVPVGVTGPGAKLDPPPRTTSNGRIIKIWL